MVLALNRIYLFRCGFLFRIKLNNVKKYFLYICISIFYTFVTVINNL